MLGDKQEPLMIRGDRLLLALGAFIWRYIPPTQPDGTPWMCPTPNPEGWSHARICVAMEKLGDSEFLLAGHHEGRREDVYFLRRLLQANFERLASIEIDAAPLIEKFECNQWCYCHGGYVWQVRRFFEAVASGELAEADFKEQVR